jgi:hypothetical protein
VLEAARSRLRRQAELGTGYSRLSFDWISPASFASGSSSR